jgi:hypothetical protein
MAVWFVPVGAGHLAVDMPTKEKLLLNVVYQRLTHFEKIATLERGDKQITASGNSLTRGLYEPAH